MEERNLLGVQKDSGFITVGISNRHVHLARTDLEILFGKDYCLQKLKDLSQPGQYAAKECVTLIGNKSTIQNVRILGPCREKSQVELLMSDTYTLGIRAIVRESGDLNGSEGIYVAGPKGFVHLKEGAIVARRHIHMDAEEARIRGLTDKQLVKVKIGGERSVILEEAVVRVSPKFRAEFHIDIDEANACGAKNGVKAQIIL